MVEVPKNTPTLKIVRSWPRMLVWGVSFAVAGVTMLVVTHASPSAPVTTASKVVSSVHPTTAVATPTSGTLWLPLAEAPIDFQVVLGDGLQLKDPVQAGLRDFKSATLSSPAVFDLDQAETSATTVGALHAAGKKVICHIEAGEYSIYARDAKSYQQVNPVVWGAADSVWPGSFWLDIRRVSELEPIIKAKIDDCKGKGFDAVEPDHMSAWTAASGFPISYQDQLTFNKAVAAWVHKGGMSVGLKNDIEQAHDLVTDFDWALAENCFRAGTCLEVTPSGSGVDGSRTYPGLTQFVAAGKAVWVVAFGTVSEEQWTPTCQMADSHHFNLTAFKLGYPTTGGRMPCRQASTW